MEFISDKVQSEESNFLSDIRLHQILNMTVSERNAKRDEVSAKTELETKEMIDKNGRALVVRPTGFGKTYLLCKFAEKYYLDNNKDKKFLYIFPSYIIVNDIKSASGKGMKYEKIYPYLDFVSYQEINLAFGDTGTEEKRIELLNKVKESPIVLIDEVHKSASPNFRLFMEEADQYIGVDKTHLLGVTATIIREDLEETDWIQEVEFKGCRISNYTLNQAIYDGVLLPPYRTRPVFDIEEVKETANERLSHSKINDKYKKVQIDYLNNALKEWKNGSKSMYKAIEHVGFKLDSDNPDDSFMRFIVFFRNTKHLEEEGELVEEIFRKAVNEEASEALGKKIKTNVNVEYVISDTADKNNDNIVQKLCEKHKDRVYRTNAEQVCTEEVVITDEDGKKHKELLQKKPKAHQLDLIFNVNVITMGYHVPYIAGVMFLRGTNTYICNRQQLGRCMSVTNTRQPIVFDVADNLSKTFGKKQDKLNSEIEETSVISKTSTLDKIDDKEKRHRELEAKYRDEDDGTVFTIGDTEDDVSTIMRRLQDETLIKETCIYLYEERHMPIVFVANELEIPISSVLDCLRKEGITIKDESDEYRHVHETLIKFPVEKREKDAFRTTYCTSCVDDMYKYINSAKANLEVKEGSKTVYKMVRALKGGVNQ